MKKIVQFLGLTLGIFIFLSPSAWSDTPVETTAKIAFVKGRVSLSEPSGLQRTIRVGDLIKAGETLSSDETGEAVVLFPDGSRLTLSKSSKITPSRILFDKKSQNKLFSIKLFGGKIKSTVTKLLQKESRYDVITPTASCGVRGTEFIVGFDEKLNMTELLVLDGSVETFDAALKFPSVMVRANEMTLIQRGAPPASPAKADQQKINSIKNEFSKESDKAGEQESGPKSEPAKSSAHSIDGAEPSKPSFTPPLQSKPGDPSTATGKKINIKW